MRKRQETECIRNICVCFSSAEKSPFLKFNIFITKLDENPHRGPQRGHRKFMHLIQDARKESREEPTPSHRLAGFIDSRIYPRMCSRTENFLWIISEQDRAKPHQDTENNDQKKKTERSILSLRYLHLHLRVCRISRHQVERNFAQARQKVTMSLYHCFW